MVVCASASLDRHHYFLSLVTRPQEKAEKEANEAVRNRDEIAKQQARDASDARQTTEMKVDAKSAKAAKSDEKPREKTMEELLKERAQKWEEMEKAAVGVGRDLVHAMCRRQDVSQGDTVHIVGPDGKPLTCEVVKARGVLLQLEVRRDIQDGSNQEEGAVAAAGPLFACSRPGLRSLVATQGGDSTSLVMRAVPWQVTDDRFDDVSEFEPATARFKKGTSHTRQASKCFKHERGSGPRRRRRTDASDVPKETEESVRRASIACLFREGSELFECGLAAILPEEPGRTIEVVAATYADKAGGGGSKDVRDEVSEQLEDSGSKLEVSVNNGLLTDPAPGKPKVLTVRARIGGLLFTFSAAEGLTLCISAADRAVLVHQDRLLLRPLSSLVVDGGPPQRADLHVGKPGESHANNVRIVPSHGSRATPFRSLAATAMGHPNTLLDLTTLPPCSVRAPRRWQIRLGPTAR